MNLFGLQLNISLLIYSHGCHIFMMDWQYFLKADRGYFSKFGKRMVFWCFEREEKCDKPTKKIWLHECYVDIKIVSQWIFLQEFEDLPTALHSMHFIYFLSYSWLPCFQENVVIILWMGFYWRLASFKRSNKCVVILNNYNFP